MEVHELMSGNHKLFKEMNELAEKQELLISEDRIDEFLDLMKQRERIKENISRNNWRYNSIVKKNHHGGTSMVRQDPIFSEIENVIKSIRETDKRIEDLISDRKNRLFYEIKAMRKSQKAAESYGRGPSRSPRFIDRKG